MPRHFIVTGNTDSKSAYKTTRFSCVCRDLERAIQLAKAAFPNFVIMSIADQGAIDKVDVT